MPEKTTRWGKKKDEQKKVENPGLSAGVFVGVGQVTPRDMSSTERI